jgi:hypothetical protein
VGLQKERQKERHSTSWERKAVRMIYLRGGQRLLRRTPWQGRASTALAFQSRPHNPRVPNPLIPVPSIPHFTGSAEQG